VPAPIGRTANEAKNPGDLFGMSFAMSNWDEHLHRLAEHLFLRETE
jgi:hypothetical protein